MSHKHKHNWELKDVIKGKTIYNIATSGKSTIKVPTGQEPDITVYRCECGEEKQVEVQQWK